MISNKKEELDCLVQQLNIQIENPVCFLNQETSKHFLNTSNSSDKYKLFMKASQLESVKKLQDEINNQRQLSKSIVTEKESQLLTLREELWKEEEKVKKSQSLDKLKKKLYMLMNECSWSQVIFWEKTLEETEKERNLKTKSKEKHLEKLGESEKTYNDINEHYEQVEKEINDLNAKVKSINTNNNDSLMIKLKKSSIVLKIKESDYRKVNETFNRKKTNLVELEDKYNEEKNNSNTNYDKERMEKRRQISEFKQKQKQLNDIEKKKVDDNREIHLKIEKQQKQIATIELDKKSMLKENEKIESEIKKLELASKNQLLKYGVFIPDLLSDIKRYCDEGRFRQIPRGPIGSYLQTKNSEWSLAIEQAIGKDMLCAFVCGNHQDEAVLFRLINQHVRNPIMRPRVIVADYGSRLYDVNQYRPEHTQYSTVFEMLNIRDTIIANVLIDLRRIESVLLFDDYKTGENIIANRADRFCSEAYLKNGDKLLGMI